MTARDDFTATTDAAAAYERDHADERDDERDAQPGPAEQAWDVARMAQAAREQAARFDAWADALPQAHQTQEPTP